MYRNLNVFILGVLTNNLIVEYYAIAEKILKAIQSFQILLGQILFFVSFQKIWENENERIYTSFVRLFFQKFFYVFDYFCFNFFHLKF